MTEQEQDVIDQLSDYKRIVARIKVLESYTIGAGVTVSRLNQDDQLQELHRQLRGLPSYMYLTKREQKLETTANAYLTRYPAGTRAQLAEIPKHGADPEDEKLLRELRQKIEKVIETRIGQRSDIDEVLERVAELQDSLQEKHRIDSIFEALEGYKPQYAKLLRLNFLEEKPWPQVVKEMQISRAVYYRWRSRAIQEFTYLAR